MNLDGGIHEIPIPSVRGRLWLCGKHAIAPDPVSVLDKIGVDHVVCLVERFELEGRYPDYVAWLNQSPVATWFPIGDLDFVSLDRAAPLIEELRTRLQQGESILTHCGAGIGRAGTIAVSLCISSGLSLHEALRHVRLHRPGAGPEVGAQSTFVQDWAQRTSAGHRQV